LEKPSDTNDNKLIIIITISMDTMPDWFLFDCQLII
jgi:hypothetical protein